MRLKIILLLILITSSIFIFWIYSQNLSKQTRNREVLKALEKPLYLNLEDSSRATTLGDLGASYDPSTQNISFDDKKLDSYLTGLEKDYSFLSKNTLISFEDFSFKAASENAEVKINRAPFLSTDSLINMLDSNPMKLKISISTLDSNQVQTEKTNNLIDKISTPLLIKYGRNPINIPKETIRNFIDIIDDNGMVKGIINFEKVSAYLNELDSKFASDDLTVLHNEAVDAIRRALLFRAADYQVNNAVILPLEGKPKTQGELHDVYLEVIKSQQRLYRFEHGKLVKTYIVSTGLTWETPPGSYHILGKDKMAISYTGNWYMPNYLPIGYIFGQYRFGFHSIPYHMDGAGNIYSRDPNSMGSPATGGCIQLGPSDSEELFKWAWVGMPVYVYE